MAVASYTTDLTVFHTIETTPTVFEFTNYTTGGTPAVDTDYPIQGTQHLSAAMTKTGLGSIGVDYGSNPSWTSGHNFFLWGVFLPAGAVNTDAAGGLRVLIGSAISAFKVFYIGGRDFGRYPYGGWMNFVVNPELTADVTVGSPTAGQYRYTGFGIDCTSAISKGSPLGVDAIRFGRGEVRINGGDLSNGYATFADMATANDDSAAKWGLFQAEAGTYLWKGLITLGYASAVDFRDANKAIIVDNTRKVLSSFNRIEVRQATSRVDWTGVSITALGTVSKGEFEMIDNATVNIDNCTFTDMSTLVFLSNAVLTSTTFRRCGQVTINGCSISSSTFEASPDTSGALLITTPGDIVNASYCNFNDNTVGIKITSAGNYTLNGHLFDNNTAQIDYTGTSANKTITAASWAAGSATFTSAGHGYTTSTNIVVKNVVPSGYNNAANEFYTITGTTTDTFTVALAADPGTYTSGGIATLPCLISPSNGCNVAYASCTATGGGYLVVDTPSVNLTISGAVTNSEIRVIRVSDGVELGGIENTSGNWVFSHKLGGTAVDIYILHLNYEWYAIRNYTLLSENTTIPISQQFDRQYSNPA